MRRQPQRAGHVLENASGLQLHECRDLAHTLDAVLLAHVRHHLVAARHAEIDVEVRHADAIRIQEAFEEQPVLDRIEVCNAECVRHKRTRPTSAARTHGDSTLFREAYEVPDNEEVAGKVHLGDDVELERQSLLVDVPRRTRVLATIDTHHGKREAAPKTLPHGLPKVALCRIP